MNLRATMHVYVVVGGQAYLSDPVLVRPGDVVEWRLQDDLTLSTVMVR